jgi:hypothetical protein
MPQNPPVLFAHSHAPVPPARRTHSPVPGPSPATPCRAAGQVLQGFFLGGLSRIVQMNQRTGAVQPRSNSAVQLPANLANLRPGAAGSPLPEGVRQKMESSFGADFSDVRVHIGPEAPALGALAFTLGSRLYFAPGQYSPHSPHGQRLLGHELAHVVQQRAGRVRNPFGSGIAVVHDPTLEAEADRLGHRAGSQPVPPAPQAKALQPSRPPASHVQAACGQAPARSSRGEAAVQPMRTVWNWVNRSKNNFIDTTSLPSRKNLVSGQKGKISTFVRSTIVSETALEDTTREIAKLTGTTYVHPDQLWTLKQHLSLSKEPLIVVAEQADLNRKAKITKDGKVMPGILEEVRNLARKGLDVKIVPNVTVVACHSFHSISALSEELSGKMVTGFGGTVKASTSTGLIEVGVATSRSPEDFFPLPPEQQKESVKTVKDGTFTKTPPDHPAHKILSVSKI